jgi:hypothetical protein
MQIEKTEIKYLYIYKKFYKKKNFSIYKIQEGGKEGEETADKYKIYFFK